MKHASEEIEKCISMLEALKRYRDELANLPEEQRIALLKVAGEISRPDRAERKKRNKAANKTQSLATLEKDRRARNTTGIRSARIDATFTAPHRSNFVHPSRTEGEELNSPRNCYVCKEEFTKPALFLRHHVQKMRRPELQETFSDSASSWAGCLNYRLHE